jgi:hypothetical protein
VPCGPLTPVAADVALALSLVAAMRQPDAQDAFNAGVVQLPGSNSLSSYRRSAGAVAAPAA